MKIIPFCVYVLLVKLYDRLLDLLHLLLVVGHYDVNVNKNEDSEVFPVVMGIDIWLTLQTTISKARPAQPRIFQFAIYDYEALNLRCRRFVAIAVP